MMNLSVIVPAYNEEKRMVPFLKDMINFCDTRLRGSFEVLLIDDGSTDQTVEVARSIARGRKYFRVVSHEKNMGKGAAIQTGVNEARGETIIFIDADGSIAPSEIPTMTQKLKEYDVVIGSRTLEGSRVEQPIFRRMTGGAFNLYSNLLFAISVDDTLCGFKGFRRSVAKELFSDLKSKRWIFDVEILCLSLTCPATS